jgi:hypothetical protein
MRPLALLLVIAFVLPARADDYVPEPEKTSHWAWKPPVRTSPPMPRDRAWARNAIDRFIQAKWDAAELRPARPATREQLIRRVTLDLIGLPPTPAEIDAFLADHSPDAWEKVVDRLLNSPHYGERWGRHWLDLARFAESNGYEHDEIRPDAWRYRDYVVQSFAGDKPYDQFLKEQLAGDELYPDDIRARVATGFNLLGPDMTDAANQLQRRQNTLDDMTDTAGLVFLGLTIGCARCHDHKFEPIPQSDFYRLQAFFAPAMFRKDVPIASKEDRDRHAAAQREYQALVKPTLDEITKLEEPHRKRLTAAKLALLSDAAQLAHRLPADQRTPEQKGLVIDTMRLIAVTANDITNAYSSAEKQKAKELQKQLASFNNRKPPPLPGAMGIEDGNKAAKTVVLLRGELKNQGEEVAAGFPLILSPGFAVKPANVSAPSEGTSGRRAALARWLTDKDNPLTARVMVNRLWQHHFGRGIVATPNDFGIRGEYPTHRELLDWLAREFVDSGWSIKHMHRLMLVSATYQQSTHASKNSVAKDPTNSLLSRMNRMRLEGEVIRDSLLAVSGRLDRAAGGPSVPPSADNTRRSIYVFAKRNAKFAFLEPFDLPDDNQSCSQRERSTTAPQALTLLNATEAVAAAKALAVRLEREAASPSDRIELAFRLALGRGPSATELDIAREFLAESPLAEFCRTLFNVNEFVYVD